MKHYLITGGAGFIGSNLIRNLLKSEPGLRITCICSTIGLPDVLEKAEGNLFGRHAACWSLAAGHCFTSYGTD